MKPTFSAHIITPSHIERVDNISFFRAEDQSGSFGILPRHIEFLTILEPSIAIAMRSISLSTAASSLSKKRC